MRTLTEAGAPNPNTDAGLAFADALLEAGYDRQQAAEALRDAISAAGDEADHDGLYTNSAGDAANRFRQALTNSLWQRGRCNATAIEDLADGAARAALDAQNRGRRQDGA